MLPDALAQFVSNERVCVLSVLLPDGSVHSAPVVFWCNTGTVAVYMATSKSSEKVSWLQAGACSAAAAISIGNEKNMPFLLQLRGTLEVAEKSSIDERDFESFMRVSDARDNPQLPQNLLLRFTPSWARYTDWETGEQHRVLS